MKIKKFGKAMIAVILGGAMCLSTFAFTACGKDKKDDNNNTDPPMTYEDPTKATCTVTADKTSITVGAGDKVTITVTIDGLTDKSNTLSLEGNGAKYVELNGNVLSMKAGLVPTIDTEVYVVATSTVASSVTGSVKIEIKTARVDGNVGDLTNAMFDEVGNSKITVTGNIVDVYDDFNNNNNDSNTQYDFTTKMSDGAWYGEWNRHGSDSKDISNYRSSTDTFSSSNGVDYHYILRKYIDKDNNVAEKKVTNYVSEPAAWEEQHLWNHLNLFANEIEGKWTYNADNQAYQYLSDNTSEEDLYFRTYLAVSLTPMLGNSDTLDTIFVKITDSHITSIIATTFVTYFDATGSVLEDNAEQEDIAAMSYTTLEANFSEVGTTTVPEPTPYAAPTDSVEQEAFEKLQSAMTKMNGATNYTFQATENTISAPSYDESDYEFADDYSVKKARVADFTAASGTVGVKGQVTADGILLATTGKYSSSSDGNDYYTKYSGYKKISDSIYDYFEYSGADGALKGKKQYQGDMIEKVTPKFNFSPYLFELAGVVPQKVGSSWVNFYQFALREPAITRDIAMEISMHSYAEDAEGSTYGTLMITVDGNGNLVSTSFPYDLVSGTYLGVIETTYSYVGTTTIPEDTWDGYIARVIRDEWSQFSVMYYHEDHDTRSPYGEIDAATLFEQIYGTEAANLPKPTAFTNVFADNMTECFFSWDDITNEAGTVTGYKDYISVNLSVDTYDENYQVSKEIYDDVMSRLTTELAKYGFTPSLANCGEAHGSRWMTYVNGNIMIRIENNKTRNFFMDFLKVGWWTLNKD